MPEKTTKSPVTLEDLLRLKRAERPPEEFWAKFEAELHTRQLAAAVDKPRWWFALPRIFAGLSRYQMPMGAAAVLAVTFLVVQDYREPGLEAVSPQPVAYTPVNETVPAPIATETQLTSAEFDHVVVATTPEVVAEPAPATRTVTGSRQDSPSARSIAANLAAVDNSADWDRVLSGPDRFNLVQPTRAEPLAQVASPTEVRRERLFAYVDDPANLSSTAEDRAAPIRERLASRISEDQLYESVRRMSAGGDRLTLKF